MSQHQLELIARALVAPGRGILAADESFPTIQKRFKSIGVESTEQTRRFYREMLFTTSGIEEFISGVILFDETIRQLASDQTPLIEILVKKDIIPGIKVDKGTTGLAGFTGEKITEGLDGLRLRLMEYRQMGARFAKWRAVIKIGQGIPTPYCIKATTALSWRLCCSNPTWYCPAKNARSRPPPKKWPRPPLKRFAGSCRRRYRALFFFPVVRAPRKRLRISTR
jgi:fructose-bisphosphate aldolase class 1